MPATALPESRSSVTTTDARKDFADLINRVVYGDAEITITRHGEPLAALVSAQRLEELRAIEDRMDGLAAEKAKEEGEFMDADEFMTPPEE